MNPETFTDNLYNEFAAIGVPLDKIKQCCSITLKKLVQDTTTAMRVYYTSCLNHLKQKQ